MHKKNTTRYLQFYLGLLFSVGIAIYGYHMYIKDLYMSNFPVIDQFGTNRKAENVDCAGIINGNITNTMDLNNYVKNITVIYRAINYEKLASNCSNFIKLRGYITQSLTKEEEEFPIAYSILMYKDVEQTERLLRAIYRPQNIICIHVDKKSPAGVANALEAIAKCFDNVFLVERIRVVWGTLSVFLPELRCMEELFRRSKTWKYFINLTGQEFPLKTNYELVQHLKRKNGSNDVTNENENTKEFTHRWRNAGDPPHNITPSKGSLHMALSRDFVDFVLHDKRAQDFLKWTNKTTIPDEIFFTSLSHSLSLKPPGRSNDVSEQIPYMMRFKLWSNKQCRGKTVRKVCIFGTGDLPMLAAQPHMFANKFHFRYGYALDCVEELHYNRTRDLYWLYNK